MATLNLTIQPQPDPTTCGPTCLHAVYRYWGDELSLEQLIAETPALPEGGTLAVHLGAHALDRGYRARLYSFNLNLFDPTWFREGVDLRRKLDEQASEKHDPKLRHASRAYADFLARGGEVQMDDLTPNLIRRHIAAGRPILAGVSATRLYNCARELPDGAYDDVRGTPQGHFVVVAGLRGAEALVADPWPEAHGDGLYWVANERLVNSILLGVLTYDGNLLIVEPRED